MLDWAQRRDTKLKEVEQENQGPGQSDVQANWAQEESGKGKTGKHINKLEPRVLPTRKPHNKERMTV
jgi:hypothetical protein